MRDVNVIWVKNGNFITQAIEGIGEYEYIDSEGMVQYIEPELFYEYFDELEIDDLATKMFSDFVIMNKTEDGEIEKLYGNKFDYIVRDSVNGNFYSIPEIVFENFYYKPIIRYEEE